MYSKRIPYGTSCTWHLTLKGSVDVVSPAALENTFFLPFLIYFFPVKKPHMLYNSFVHVQEAQTSTTRESNMTVGTALGV